MSRLSVEPEELFVENIKKLITNILINNINYSNGYYANKTTYDVIKDTKERANYILQEIEQTKHLIHLIDNTFKG